MNSKGYSLVEILIVVVIIGIIIVVAIPNFQESQRAAQTNAALATLRNLGAAQAVYFLANKQQCYGNLDDLSEHIYLDGRFSAGAVTYDGYTFSSEADRMTFTFHAAPVDPELPGFFLNHTMALYYENGDPLPSN